MSGGTGFPAQHQTQVGVEETMNPKPSVMREAYKGVGKLKGKVALVTGGDSGIGRAVAVQFAAEGASVAITYVAEKEKEDAYKTLDMARAVLGEEGKDPVALQVDLGFEENCKNLVHEVIKHFGVIDVLVNNCAEQHMHQSLSEVTTEEWDRTFRTNIYSYFWVTKYAEPHMKDGGSIINTTSVLAYQGAATLIPYATTKGAIVAFTRSLALNLAPRGIRVNGVAPGPVWTPLIPATFEAESVKSFGEDMTAMKRPGQPEEIAPSYTFLASRNGAYFTGQVLHPNGGMIVNA
eukprot:TRINITY_DN29471_c0_g1_i1.p1 TRINITY_DN29471_c0_g1~~TRINITY_DN29471_c0_g1_i1.p1  ORF type:complete len:292 (+),score=62.54 TRINITY_DN29471_c0_g1_i1:506-1381(+)